MITNTQIPADVLPTEDAFTHDLFRVFRANDARLDAFCTPEIAHRFYRLTEEMLRVNAYMNLTAIKSPRGILVRHYADCAPLIFEIPENASLCDIGCGGGFPSLPTAILRPDVRVTSVDSTKKKLDYVQNTAALLGLSNLSTRCARAEELGASDLRESFDVVCARAVAPMPILCEWCLPLVRKNGFFLAMKGKNGEQELSSADHAIRVLGGQVVSFHNTILCDPFAKEKDAALSTESTDSIESTDSTESADEEMHRCIITIRKASPTPKQYPRSNAQIKKNPL